MLRVCDEDLRAGKLEGGVDEAGTLHGLDRCPDRLTLCGNEPHERSQCVRVARAAVTSAVTATLDLVASETLRPDRHIVRPVAIVTEAAASSSASS